MAEAPPKAYVFEQDGSYRLFLDGSEFFYPVDIFWGYTDDKYLCVGIRIDNLTEGEYNGYPQAS